MRVSHVYMYSLVSGQSGATCNRPTPVAPAVLGAPYISHREGRPYRLLAARQVIHPSLLIILPLKFFLKHTDPLADT